jgi:hypothetical protein
MHPGEKHPSNPVVKRGGKSSPDEYRAQYLGSVTRQGGKFKMWYIAADAEAIAALSARPASVRGWRVAYAESQDGIKWVKPNLGLVDYHGSRDNNLVAIDPPELMGWHVIVNYEPDDPEPSHRFKMMLMTRWPRGSTSMPLFSGDGLHWRLAVEAKIVNNEIQPESMVLPIEFFEQGGFYQWQGMYYMTGQQIYPSVWLAEGQICGRILAVFRSPDFTHWLGTKSQGYLRWGYRPTKLDNAEEVHEPGGMWNRGNVLLGVFGMLHGSPTFNLHPIDLGLLISNDGIHFREPVPDFTFLPRGDPGSWDSQALLQGNGFENVNDKTYYWYGGWDTDVTRPDDHSEIGLATLRQDGFGSLSPIQLPESINKYPFFPLNKSAPAAFVTCPIKINGTGNIWVNADGFSDEARLRLELVDEMERPISGYSGDRSASSRQSGVRVPVAWKSNDRLVGLQVPFKVKVSFEGKQRLAIKFYALYIGQ